MGFKVWGVGFGVWGVGRGVWGVKCGLWVADPHRLKPQPLTQSDAFPDPSYYTECFHSGSAFTGVLRYGVRTGSWIGPLQGGGGSKGERCK